MSPDLLNMDDMNVYIGEKSCGKMFLMKNATLSELKVDTDDSTYCDLDFNPSTSFSFHFNKKHWYSIQKALGLITPKYRRFRKGKRYILKEVIE